MADERGPGLAAALSQCNPQPWRSRDPDGKFPEKTGTRGLFLVARARSWGGFSERKGHVAVFVSGSGLPAAAKTGEPAVQVGTAVARASR